MPSAAPLLRRSPRAIAALVAAAVLDACTDAPGAPVPPPPTSVDTRPLTIVPAFPVRLVTGYLRANVAATGAGITAESRLVWQVADSAIATVSPDADIRFVWIVGRRAGSTTIVVRDASSGARAELPLTVVDPPPMPWPAVPPTTARVGDVAISASLAIDSTTLANGVTEPARYTVRATLRNTAGAPRTVRLGACPVWITVHQATDWYGRPARPPVWNGDSTGTCGGDGAETPITLAGGATHEVTASVVAATLLAPRLERFGQQVLLAHLHANLRIDGVPAVVEAGATSLALPTGALRVRATSELAQARTYTPDVEPVIVTQATITNVGSFRALLEYGICNVTLFAHRTADRSGSPVWRSDAVRPWEGTYSRGCPMPGVGVLLQPGDSVQQHFRETTRLVELLGDSLPDGRYWLTARVRLLAPRTTFDVDAGALDLALSRPPLPAERAYDGALYRASSALAPAGSPRGTVRLTVVATQVNGGALRRFPAACVVRLLAYRDRARRDAAPLSGDADWRQPLTGCAPGTQTLSHDLGQRLTFTTDAPVAEILGGGRPAGRYHLAALVRAEGRDLYLSAGELDLAR
jgi:hypothetical protein